MSKCKICTTEFHHSSCDPDVCFDYDVCPSCWQIADIKKTWNHYQSEIDNLCAKRDNVIKHLIYLSSLEKALDSLPTEKLDEMLDTVVDQGLHKKYSALERMLLDSQ